MQQKLKNNLFNSPMALLCILTTCTALIFCFGFANCQLQTINVDKSSPSSFSTIQGAIDSVPSNNDNWIIISVKAGTYMEQVKISSDKPFIYIKGEVGQTFIVWGYSISIADSATFESMADNILVTGITFVNSYNYPASTNSNPVKPAVAATISGDKSAFYYCTFLGYQDTLYDLAGRHYFNNCNITGAVDFIFGNGKSIYEWCILSVNLAERDSHRAFIGFVTAQGREDPNDNSGFVFKNCDVVGKGSVYLGRAWRPHSRVIFTDSFLSEVVVPRGWDAWDYAKEADGLTFAEEGCRGIGSDKSKRVWERNLSQAEFNSLTSISYIDDHGWISSQPSQ